jgi:hypothetical protein
MRLLTPLCVIAASMCSVLLSGCSMQSVTTAETHAAGISGAVHGGQQPISGATIQLWTVGTTGDGSAATPLIGSTVTTDANGNFSLANTFSCNGATEVYITATGGNPGLSAANPNIGEMTAIGQCTSINSSTFISINELTTVAAVEALLPFMNASGAVGSATSDVSALNAAFTLAAQLVNTSTGQAPGSGLPAGYTSPVALIDTLGDILSGCVNSTGFSQTGVGPCNDLFAAEGSIASSSTTITAMYYVATNPTTDPVGLLALVPSSAPFQPTLATVPPTYAVQLTATGSAAGLQLSTSSLSYGSTTPFAGMATQSVTLQNVGSSVISLVSISPVGVNSADFTANSGCSSTLQPNASCTVQLIFTPLGAGSRYAYLQVISNAPAPTQYVSLSGTGSPLSSTPLSVFVTGPASSSTGYNEIYTYTNSAIELANTESTYTLASPNTVGPLTTDFSGNLYASTVNSSQSTPVSGVQAFTIGSGGALTPSRSYTLGSNITPLSIAADGTGKTYLYYETNSTPYVGVVSATASGSGVTPSFSLANYGYYVAVDPSKNLYAFDSSENLNEFASGFTASSTPTRTINLSSYYGSCFIAAPDALTTDSAGNVYVLITGGDSCSYSILEFSPTSSTPTRIIAGTNIPLLSPGSIAVDAYGTIYVTDLLNAGGGSSVVYEWASSVNGNVAPTSLFAGPFTNGPIAIH